MRKKIWTTIISCVLIFTASVFITGCNQEETVEIVNPITVSISITYPTEAKLENIVDQEFRVEESSTVSSALQLYCNVNSISSTMDTTSGTITGISNVTNGDIDAAKSWKYKLNGEAVTTPAGEQILESGDKIEWIYE